MTETGWKTARLHIRVNDRKAGKLTNSSVCNYRQSVFKKSGKVQAYAGRNLCSLDLTYQFRYASPQVESNAFIFPAMSINGQSAFLVVLIENGVVNDSNWGGC